MAITVMCVAAATASAGPRLAELPERPRELTRAALAQGDANWDERAGLLWAGRNEQGSRVHGVRPTSWYALGLLLRGEPGDRERAVQALEAVLRQQIDAPGMPWHGTFFRRAEEPRPMPGAKMWDDYDPNWRQFIGCTFAQVLIDYADELPEALRERLLRSIALALEGEHAHGRLKPAYTNIALMQGFLLGFAGERLARPGWISAAAAWVGEIGREFVAHESFDEYNSPTYYGVDLYGLALLRAHGATPELRATGAHLEAALWRDIGRFYHAGLRNLAGPYDRAYGMDLQEYVALAGTWMGFVLPAEATPLPAVMPARHGGDFNFTPCFALLGAKVPAEVQARLETFSGERLLERPIADGKRVATAWLGRDLMIGAQDTALSRGVPQARSQFHPATIHWRRPDGAVAWLALRECSRVNARAEPRRLHIAAIGDATFRIETPGLKDGDLRADSWQLPGLDVRIEHDARNCEIKLDATGATLVYREATRFTLHCEP